jgi:hypothetical protein
MLNPEKLEAFLRKVVNDDANIDIRVSGPMVDVRAHPGNYEDKDWEVEICIDSRAPVLPAPTFWSADAGDIYHHVKDTGDRVPREVVDYTRKLMHTLRESNYQLLGLSGLEQRALNALHNIVLSSNADDHGSLMNAIQEAQSLTSRFYDYTPETDLECEWDLGGPRPTM